MIRVIVVDDYAKWRLFVASVLRTYPELQIVAEAADGPEALLIAQELQPDLILLDIGLPRLNGIEVARQLRKVSPTSKILFVSQTSSVEVAQAALNEGADGFVIKSEAGRDLLPAVEAVLEGKRFVSARLGSLQLIERR
jgi:DNA-binding NarL/FixJ family response regulator